MNEIVRQPAVERYRIGDWIVEPLSLRVWKEGQEDRAQQIRPLSMSVLVYMVERAGKAVTHEALLNEFWRGSISSTNAVHKAIAELRHVFENGDRGNGESRYIATIPRQGYRLVASIEPLFLSTPPEKHLITAASGNDFDEEILPKTVAVEQMAEGHSPGRDRFLGRRIVVASAFVLLGVAMALVWTKVGFIEKPFEVASMPVTESVANDEEAQSEPQHSLAILPFSYVSGKDDLSWLATGLTDELKWQLSRVPQFVVKRAEKDDPIEAGRTLAVTHFLSGAIEQTEDRVHVDFSLRNTSQGTVLFSRQWDAPIEELAALRDRISQEVLDALMVHTDAERVSYMNKGGTDDPTAYLLVLKGKALLQSSANPEDRKRAEAMFRDALERDPGYADSYSWLDGLILEKARYQTVDVATQVLAELDLLLAMAREHSPDSGVVHSLEYARASFLGELPSQESALRALSKNVDSPVRRYLGVEDLYAGLLWRAGLFDDAKQFSWLFHTQRVSADQKCEFLWEHFNITLWLRGADVALPRLETVARNVLSIGDQVDVDSLSPLVTVNAHEGRIDEARKWLELLKQSDTQGLYYRHAELMLRAFSGELTTASPEYVKLVELSGSWLGAAQVALVLGDIENGLDWMRQMTPFERGIFITSRWLIEYQFPNEVREDPRYRAMLEDLGIGETFRKIMEAGVRELTPYTGIHLAAEAPDKVVLGNWRYEM